MTSVDAYLEKRALKSPTLIIQEGFFLVMKTKFGLNSSSDTSIISELNYEAQFILKGLCEA